jgi:hypothetical protein
MRRLLVLLLPSQYYAAASTGGARLPADWPQLENTMRFMCMPNMQANGPASIRALAGANKGAS